MILQHLPYLNNLKIVLASGSPRRISLLKDIGLEFSVFASNTEENSSREKVENFVIDNSILKAKVVSIKNPKADLIISADTVVYFKHKIIEKPKNYEQAKEILLNLCGLSHSVYSGVCLISSNQVFTFLEKTDVKFSNYSMQFIESYCQTIEPYDKAGAYGIQGLGSTFVEEISGCYFNVMGLPVNRLCKELISLMEKKLL